jgi:hypothetical protein
LFLCNSFVMDVSRLACCCFSSSLYTSTQEHTVRKLLQFSGMSVRLVRSFCTEKISLLQFETCTVFLYC